MLEAGQVLYDNDPRYRGRKVEVIRVDGSYAVCMGAAAGEGSTSETRQA